MKNNKCCFCRERKADLIRAHSDSVDIVSCRRCGVIRKDPLPTAKYLADLYNSNYYRNCDDIGYSAYFDMHDSLIQLSMDRLCFVNKYIKSGRLLDVGCATGEFLEVASNNGWKVRGVDISNEAVNIARKRLKLEFTSGTIWDIKPEEGKFDLITMWDVIEHVIDPLRELSHAHKLLNSNGLLLICTPNASSLRARREGPNWHGYRASLEHLYYFNPSSISNLLNESGFNPIAMRTTGIDADLKILLNPFSNCRNLKSSIMEQTCQYAPMNSRSNLVKRLLEYINMGHVMIAIGRKKQAI